MRRARAWLSDLPWADRVAVGLGLVLVPLFGLSGEEAPEGIEPRSFDAGAVLVLAAACLALLARRRWPGTTVLVVTGLTVTWYASGYGNGSINIPVLIAFYNLGTTGDRRRQVGVGALALAIPVFVILVLSDVPSREAFDAVGYPLAALLFGELVRSRRLLLGEYAAKAEAAQRDAEAEAERRVTGERLRIAQDVHDVLAHAISVMTVQAAAGADALDRDPAVARKALADIRTAGKGAMAELRATVAVLRSGGGPGAVATAAPAPRLDRLAELVDGARAQGLDVELTLDAGPGDGRSDGDGLDGLDGVETLVQLAAYRVVQEGLTNVIRHAGAGRAEVRLERRPSELVVTVSDDGRGAGGRAGGEPACFGLRGMRERVESLGGGLRFGPRPAVAAAVADDGDAAGWEVVATLPVGTAGWSAR
jgi:signal transduction histidine kinase